jgi:two-component system response regulator RegA
MNYLLIDDDQVFSSVLARVLTRRGYSVATACNGVEALAQCRQSKFQRVVLDLKLERESGLSILQQLRDLQPDIQIVLLTGYSSISTAVEAIKLGAVNYLGKPASVDEIIAAFEPGQVAQSQPRQISPPSVSRVEWEHIQRVLNENDGNVSATARILGMHRRTLQRKLQKRPVKQ